MVTIGNDTLPGTITTLESSASAGVSLSSAGIPVIVGGAYLQGSTANASADEVKRITRYRQAATEFGDRSNSQLTRAVQDALTEGAYPVFAIAPQETEVTGEDLSGVSGNTGTLANAPVQEVADDIVFTINSTTKTTVLYRDGDPSNASPGSDEVYLNPVTGEYNADEALGNTNDAVDYWHLDYTNVYDEIDTHRTSDTDELLRNVIDFVGLVEENDSAISDLETATSDLESNGGFVIGVAGAGDPWIDDAGTSANEISSYSHNYDTSRLQLIHPSRDSDGNTAVGSYIGARGRVGIDSTPIFKDVRTQDALQINLTRNQRETLVTQKAVPIEERSGSARIGEDLTTVKDNNTEEQSWTQGSARLITDFVAEEVEDVASRFVGEFNNPTVLNAIQGLVSDALGSLRESRQLEDYSLNVDASSDTVALVDVGIDTADPLRNIELVVSAGAVDNGVTVEGA